MGRTLVSASQDRLRRLRRALRQRGLAGYVATSGVEVSYLSGFGGDDSYLWIPARGKAVLVTDFRYAEDAFRDCPHVRRRVRKGPLAAEVARLVQGQGGPLALNPNAVTVHQRRGLARALSAASRRGRRTASVRLKDLPDVVARMRMCKDPTEVRAIRRAVRIAETAYEDFLGRLRLGMTEARLAAELEYCLRRRGSEGTSFPTICAVGANASRPHHRPGARRLSRRTPLLVDFGAVAGGYTSDLTRMVFVTRIARDVRRAYEAVLEAQEAAIAVAAPGVAAAAVDAAARNVLSRHGYAKAFGHGTGHGIGRQVHEAPIVSQMAGDTTLEPGMVITVEPGVYVPHRFGIRIEDDVLITAKGCEVLSRLPRQIDAVRLTGVR